MLCRTVVMMLKITSHSNKTNAQTLNVGSKIPGGQTTPEPCAALFFFQWRYSLKASEGGASVPQHLQHILHEASLDGHLDALYRRR
jgi:hypothetical protein